MEHPLSGWNQVMKSLLLLCVPAAGLLAGCAYDPDPYGTGSHTRRAGEPDLRSAEYSMRHGSVVSGFSAMGNNG